MIGDVLLLLAVGTFAGVLAGFLGIGGGTVMVPVMVALGLSGVEAVGTSTLAILIISLGGSLQNWRMGSLNLKNVLLLGLPSVGTAFLGTALASYIPEHGLLGIFGVFLLLNIYLIGIKKRVVAQAKSQEGGASTTPDDSATSIPSHPRNPVLVRMLIGGIAGFLAGLFGVGGGVVMVPLQILLLRENIKVAIQTSLGAIVVTALSACGWHSLQGNVVPLTGALLGLGGLVGVQGSTRYLPKLPDRVVTLMFRGLLAFFAVYFFYRAWVSWGVS
ncbi:anion permease [Leptolyngbya sp. BL0902]|uniref:sulfite exporter TauE/SafE family protein n=1 Tax=Leptolyngbya sp. BL0902 TaxID=1115757 RepID=UPI0018E90115|nr:sulfite exporter TauE/SafE family protein [Leptolyngbya sp. BL0902]QQE65990.1 anion permease [Leptolyngbya sp. BL0902]